MNWRENDAEKGQTLSQTHTWEVYVFLFIYLFFL